MKRVLPVVVLTLLVLTACLFAVSRAQTPALPDQRVKESEKTKEQFREDRRDSPPSSLESDRRLPESVQPKREEPPTENVEDRRANPSVTFEELPARPHSPDVPMRRVRRVRTVVEESVEPVPKEEVAEAEAIKKLEPRLKLADGDKLKEAAVMELEKLLKKAFDRDLDRREKEIADVENRVSRLRDQIKKRLANKEAIVKLRLQTMVNDAAGLGFPSPYDELQPRSSYPSPTIEWRNPSDYYEPRSVETPFGAPPVRSRKRPVLDPELPRKSDKSGDQKALEHQVDS